MDNLIQKFYTSKLIGTGKVGVVKEWCLCEKFCGKTVIKAIPKRKVLDIHYLLDISERLKMFKFVPRVLKYFKSDNYQFLVMDYINGLTLNKCPENNFLNIVPIAFRNILQIHNMGVCHKDLNSNNIIVHLNNVSFVDLDTAVFTTDPSDVSNDLITMLKSFIVKRAFSPIHKKTMTEIRTPLKEKYIQATLKAKIVYFVQDFVKKNYSQTVYQKIELDIFNLV